MATLANLARMSVTGGGTGTLALLSAGLGALTFTQAGVPDGATVSYSIINGVQAEVGRGVYNSGAQTLTRGVLKSTNGNALIDVVGAAQVFVTALAEDFGDINTALGKRVAVNGAQAFTFAEQGQARANIGAGVLSGFRNKIINGDFTVNQRGGTRTPGIGVYGFDRWKGHAVGLQQIIEDLPAGEYTLTWTGGGTGVLFSGSAVASPAKATWAGGNASVFIPSNATRVSLVPGDATTESDPFSPRHISQEKLLCQRYYQRYYYRGLATATSSGQWLNVCYPVVPSMRISPTIGTVGADAPANVDTLNTVYQSVGDAGYLQVYASSNSIGSVAFSATRSLDAEF